MERMPAPPPRRLCRRIPHPAADALGRLNADRAAEMLGRWRESGSSAEAFCASVGISTKTLHRWRLRLEGSGRDSDAGRVGFAPVVVTPRASADSFCGVEVIAGPLPRVRLPPDVDEDLLRRVLRACTC